MDIDERTTMLENGIKVVKTFTGKAYAETATGKVVEEFIGKTYIETATGKRYEVPKGMDAQKYYELMQGVCSLIKEKETTIKQTQKLYLDCSEMILEMKYN